LEKAGGSGDVRARQMVGAASGVWIKIQEILEPSAMTCDSTRCKVEEGVLSPTDSRCVQCGNDAGAWKLLKKQVGIIMKAIFCSIAVAAALVGGAAYAQNTDAANLPVADPAAMKAALARAVAKGEISPGDAAEMAKIPDLLMAERKAAEIGDRLRAIEDLEERAVARQR
jgi:hypothetical protein